MMDPDRETDADGFQASELGRLIGGDIFHGQLELDRRGAGYHPGDAGAPGHNAARQLLKDLRRGR